MCYRDAFYLPCSKDEGVCRAAYCQRSNDIHQYFFIKFKDSGILSLVGVLLSCKWTIIRAELSERNFNVHHSGYFLAGNCGKFAQL